MSDWVFKVETEKLCKLQIFSLFSLKTKKKIWFLFQLVKLLGDRVWKTADY